MNGRLDLVTKAGGERSDRAWRAFAPEASEVFSARRFVASVLDAWGLEIEDLPLLVSELATNAVLHARSDFEVTVIRFSRRIRVEVFDQNTRLPTFAVGTSRRLQRAGVDDPARPCQRLGRGVPLGRRQDDLVRGSCAGATQEAAAVPEAEH